MIAESWQEKERNIQDKLKKGTERIKQTFKGDEQYMILNTYYRQNHYHPIMALRSSFSLLIQIPFFIAAYNFLSSLEPLKGYSFLFIKDFGNPDATFKLGSFSINILPIAMTLINCIAGFIYSNGFTYYPNTVSLGKATMLGSPGLYGGYEYTPHSMINYPEKTLQQKQNEALLTIPVMLHKEGYDVTVSDLPYENYLEQPVSNMYKNAPYVKRLTTHGYYSKLWYRRHGLESKPQTSFKIKRNFICFSIFKILPTFLREFVYSHDYWLPFDPYDDARFFVDNYSELEFLPELFDFENKSPSYTVIDNETWHNSNLLSSDTLPNLGKSVIKDDVSFKIHLLAMHKLGLFFDYLRKNEVYDNTRIIIVSDHGKNIDNSDFQNKMPYSRLTATLLFKDFNCNDELKYDYSFMTNADAPYLATKNITSKLHPFTNLPLQVSNKKEYLYIANPGRTESTRNRYNYKFNINDDEWMTLIPQNNGEYNIYNLSTWKKTGE